MRLSLLASTCLSALVATAPAAAQTLIETQRTTQARTSTIKSGAADDIRITSAGSVVPTSGDAVVVDSPNRLTNEGTIQVTNADGATGVMVTAASGPGIANSGKIIVDETYTATDDDKDGDIDGPFAAGRDRAGIRTTGAFAGPIGSSGSITVEGNDSFGIRLGGALTGAFTNDGTIAVTGDRAVGVRLENVTGNVRLAGTIATSGRDAVAARLDGDIAGALVVQGTIAASGYRATTAPSDTSKLDADDLLQGGTALVVGGSVSGGIILAVPPRDASTTDNDEDKDGIEDSKEGSAGVTSYGAAPAMLIGATDRAITIGPVAGTGTGFGLVVDGGIAGQGVYSGVTANGLVVGGRGGAVSIAGGIGVTGRIEATANGASATALRLGAGASTPELRNAGTIGAGGGGTAASTAVAVAIDAGGSLPTIRNSGTIRATASGVDGTAIAILDRSGSVALVENSGAIGATGALAASDRNVAIDLSANVGGATVRQTAVAAGVTAPAIVGDVRFGGGSDLFEIADGSVKGNAGFGAGANRLTLSGDAIYSGAASFGAGNDQVSLGGTSVLEGTLDFGGGADTLTLSGTARVSATLANARGLAVTVTGGTLEVGRSAAIGSLALGGGTLGVTLDRTGGTGTFIDVAGQASFAEGSKLALRLASVTDAEGRYVVLRAGSLSGASNLAALTTLLPFLYRGTVTSGANEVAVDITRKTAGELGLNRSQTSAYPAVFAALAGDAKVAGAFLGITEGDGFRRALRQMLPDHAGGTFEMATQGSRVVARILADPRGPFKDEGRWGYWISQFALGTSKDVDATAGYSITGWGLAAGAEYKTGLGNLGLSLNYLNGQDNDKGTANEVRGGQWEVAGYWRLRSGGLSGHARVSAGRIDFDGSRRFDGKIGTEEVTRTTKGDWKGTLVTAGGGLSYEMGGDTFTLRPIATIDYHRLKEGGYSETGGGKAVDLIVRSRTSDELAATGSIAAGLDFGGWDQDSGWMRIEIEGGRRQIVGGKLGATTARFDGGQSFTLTPEERTSGWIGKLRAVGGSANFRLGGELNAEQQQDRAVLALRVSLQIGL